MADDYNGNPLVRFLFRGSLVLQIIIDTALVMLVALVAPGFARSAGLLGDLFIGALKAIAALLVFILVAAAVTSHQRGGRTHVGPIVVLYLVGTFAAALAGSSRASSFPRPSTCKCPRRNWRRRVASWWSCATC